MEVHVRQRRNKVLYISPLRCCTPKTKIKFKQEAQLQLRQLALRTYDEISDSVRSTNPNRNPKYELFIFYSTYTQLCCVSAYAQLFQKQSW